MTQHTNTGIPGSPAHHSVSHALAAYKEGKFVIIVDDEDRENEGDLAIAADAVTPAAVNFMATEGRGLICIAMRAALIDRLNIPMMVPDAHNNSGFGTGFTVSVEAASGVTTGISAADRSHTIRTLVAPDTTVNDIAMPGHIFPLRARDGGVLERRGQTEASVDLAVLAERTPAGVICELMAPDGTMLRGDDLHRFAAEHEIPVVSVEALAAYRRATESAPAATQDESQAIVISNAQEATADPLLRPMAVSKLPTRHGVFDMHVFRDDQGAEHSALVMGEPSSDLPLVRLHSECLTGDAFGSMRCDCGEQLQLALARIAERGTGAVLYLRQEGRGIGLANKIRAYELQDQGLDTVDANEQLGFPADARRYDMAVEMLRSLGITRLELLTNNPAKTTAIKAAGIEVVSRLAHQSIANDVNLDYLRTKADRMGHELDNIPGETRSVTNRSQAS